MKRSTWRVLAFSALLGVGALPASAQVVIGGSGSPNVEVNWSVLDRLGRQPTLADMLKSDVPVSDSRAALNQPKSKAVEYRPYKAGAQPYAKPGKASKPVKAAAAKPKKSSVVPASAKTQHMADLVQSSRSPAPAEVKPVEVPRAAAQPPVPPKAPVAAMPEIAKPAAPAPIGPQVALPETPKAAPVSASAPVQLAKEDVRPPADLDAAPATPAATAQPAPLPPTALTPPPVVAKPEPAPQVVSLPPTPAPAPVAAAKGGDSLSVAFAGESARLPDASHADLDRLVKRMQKDDSLGLQLLAYAEGDEANASKARRLSLSRALEVRKYLMEQGMRSTRIEVRALGNKLEGRGPADRVDAILVSR